jgi:hypothetical protein
MAGERGREFLLGRNIERNGERNDERLTATIGSWRSSSKLIRVEEAD